MNSPYRFASSAGLLEEHPERALQTDGRSLLRAPLTRRYEIAHLTPSNDVQFDTVVAPATPVFEDAFAAFGRGTLIATEDGPVAVEDILPGTRVETAQSGMQVLLWVGSMTLSPKPVERGGAAMMLRVPADSFGMGRPMPDLILGPRARFLLETPACVPITGAARAFAPAAGYADGETVVQITPHRQVQVYHLCFRGQQTIFANGLEVESYHPGPDLTASLTPEMVAVFLTLFPHVAGLRDFGALQTGRLTRFELEQIRST